MKVLGISGSPIINSNIDQTIKIIMDSCGLEGEFIKLSRYQVNPCLGCLKCAYDNKCVQKDDYSKTLEGMVKEADALIIGGFPTFASLDARTKTFCERTYSLRHVNFLTQGKLAIVVAGGYKGNQLVEDYLKIFCKAQGMELVGSMQTCGNMTCLSCGYGEECFISNVKAIYGEKAKIEDSMFKNIEHMPKLQEEARSLGLELKKRLLSI